MNETEKKNLHYEGRQGKFRYEPKRTMTGYQAGLMAKFVVFATGQGEVEACFDEVYAETQEHWEKLP